MLHLRLVRRGRIESGKTAIEISKQFGINIECHELFFSFLVLIGLRLRKRSNLMAALMFIVPTVACCSIDPLGCIVVPAAMFVSAFICLMALTRLLSDISYNESSKMEGLINQLSIHIAPDEFSLEARLVRSGPRHVTWLVASFAIGARLW